KYLEDGHFMYYHPSGKIESEGEFVKGVKVGNWSRYDATGKRTHDSTYYYQGGQRQYTRYQYNTSNQLVAQYGVNAVTGDTTYRTFYSYQDGLLKTFYSENFDQSTDDWSTWNADSMEISNGKVTNRITYALYIENDIISIRPNSNEAYTYNTDGTLNTILTKRWDGTAWYDFTRLEVLYSNGKPMLAPVYYATEGGFETSHSMQYVFNFLSGVNELKQTAGINNMYPNPASEQLNVTLNNTNNATFSVFDLAGKLVEQGNTAAGMLTIDLHNYTNGIYYLNITSEEETSTRKFIVAK
ncbi:MAG: T9SS type A sorting domain-containing protein, partial [Bacteroidota bacterium]